MKLVWISYDCGLVKISLAANLTTVLLNETEDGDWISPIASGSNVLHAT